MISNVRNLIVRRDLLRELVLSELRASTAETKLGWLWWFLDPLLQMLIYWAIVVGILGRGREEWSPYPVFVLCAILTWKHFSRAASSATKLLQTKEPLIKAVPFPTMILPIAQICSDFAFFCFGLVVVIVVSLLMPHGHHGGNYLPMLQLPVLMVLQIIVVTGIVLPLSCFGVLFRDLKGIIEHLLRIGFYLSPGLYGADMVRSALAEKLGPWLTEKSWASWLPENIGEILFFVYMLNPFAILIQGYRDAVFYGEFLPLEYWIVITVEAVVFFIVGYRIFQHYDRRVIKFL